MSLQCYSSAGSLGSASPPGPSSALSSSKGSYSDLQFSLLPEEEISRYKNVYAAQVLIPEIFRVVLGWGCTTKHPDKTYLEYLKEEKNLTVRQLKQKHSFYSRHLEQLKTDKDCLTFDVTLLFGLIQVACDGLEERNHVIWNSGDDTKLECLLRKVKDIRNNVCHGVAAMDTSSDTFDQIKDILLRLIRVSGAYYSQKQSVIDNEVAQLTEKIDTMTQTSEERRIISIQYEFHKRGLEESKAYWKEYCYADVLPFSGEQVHRDKVHHSMDVSIKALSSSTSKLKLEKTMSYTKILDQWPDDKVIPITILIGEAGSGKSTVLKNISLQFLKLVRQDIAVLDNFHLIYFLECRERRSENFKAFIKNNFPNTCKKLGAQNAVDCFFYLGNLIFIDGFDERNENSSQVVSEILQKAKVMPNCQIVFTTRPHAVRDLETMLKGAGLDYRTCQLLPITREEDQVEFLRRYELAANEKSSQSAGMAETFSQLSEDIKNFFVYPINLVLFYHLYLTSPAEIKKWRTVIDVPKQILLQYEMVIEEKLRQSNVNNLLHVIRELLDEINSFALECLAEDKISMGSVEFREIQQRCSAKLSSYGLTKLVDSAAILSVVFLTRTSPSSASEVRHQFFHKTIQEMMSAKAILKGIKDSQSKMVTDILEEKIDAAHVISPLPARGSSEYLDLLRKYQTVLKFVLMDLCQQKPLRHHTREVCDLLLEAGLSEFADWAEVVLLCSGSHEVARKAVAAVKDIWWEVRTPRHVPIASMMLPLGQPSLLRVQMPRTEGIPDTLRELLSCIRQHYQGELRLLLQHSHHSYSPCDSTLAELRGARCQLRWFRGCLTSEGAVRTLVELGEGPEGPYLICSLQQPLLHPLHALHGAPHYLYATVQHTDLGDSPPPRPLPQGTAPPELIVRGTPADGGEQAGGLIVALAPQNKRFSALQLQQCSLSDGALHALHGRLLEAGVRTKDQGYGLPAWDAAGAGRDGKCRGCRGLHGAGVRCVSLHLADPHPAAPSNELELLLQKLMRQVGHP